MQNITVKRGQSLFDIALMVSGSIEATFDLALENGLSITDELTPGQKLQSAETPINKQVAEYYRINGIKPATGDILTDEPEPQDDWILATGFWRDIGIWIDSKYWID